MHLTMMYRESDPHYRAHYYGTIHAPEIVSYTQCQATITIFHSRASFPSFRHPFIIIKLVTEQTK